MCQAGTALTRVPDANTMQGCDVALAMPMDHEKIDLASDDPISFKLGELSLSNRDPLVKASFFVLAKHWPKALSFEDLYKEVLAVLSSSVGSDYEGRQIEVRQTIATALLTYRGVSLIHVWLHPPPELVPVSETPLASPVARVQVHQSDLVSNTRHQQVKLDELERILLPALDGSHDRASLLDHLRKAGDRGTMSISVNGEIVRTMKRKKLSGIVEKVLTNLRDLALLVG